MNGRYRIIDESNFNVLGNFDSFEAAVDFVATLVSVDDEYLDDLTIASDRTPILYGDELRNALRERHQAQARSKAVVSSASFGSGDCGYGYTSMAADGPKSY